MKFAVHIMTLNGESLIEKAIRSISLYSNEIIVYDTGSTDGTQDIVRNLGVKLLYENVQSISDWNLRHARLTQILNQMIDFTKSDWILRVDDDEVIPRETGEEILNLLPEVPVYSIPFLHYEDGHFIDPKCHKKDTFYVARLFKRNSDIRWVKPFWVQGKHDGAVLSVGGAQISSRANQLLLCRKLKNPFLHLGELRKSPHQYNFHEKGHCALSLGDYAQYIS